MLTLKACKDLARGALFATTNLLLFLAGALNLAIGCWYAWQNKAPIAATSLTAGLILLFAATIDRFESLKGWGIEAKTKKLDKKLEQADEALQRLKELAQLTGETLVDLRSQTGRLSEAPSSRDLYKFGRLVASTLKRMGSDDAAIAKAVAPSAWMICHDLAATILAPVNNIHVQKLDKLNKEISLLPHPLDPLNPALKRAQVIREQISEYKHGEAVNRLRLEDFPAEFLKFVDAIPSLSEGEAAGLRENAKRHAEAMTLLSANKASERDLETAFAVIEKWRSSQ